MGFSYLLRRSKTLENWLVLLLFAHFTARFLLYPFGNSISFIRNLFFRIQPPSLFLFGPFTWVVRQKLVVRSFVLECASWLHLHGMSVVNMPRGYFPIGTSFTGFHFWGAGKRR